MGLGGDFHPEKEDTTMNVSLKQQIQKWNDQRIAGMRRMIEINQAPKAQQRPSNRKVCTNLDAK